AASALAATCWSVAPGMLARLALAAVPPGATVVIRDWRLSGWDWLVPAVTTAPSASVAPEMVSAAEAANGPACCQALPLADANAVSWVPARPLIPAPPGPPSVTAGVKPMAVPRVVTNFQVVLPLEV